ncbi:MAG: tetratricopeptide repeat protein [Oligoflexia bacterium]|nr:tetratricopeptide repeat protein [Oligoflexia bacterium]
MSAKLAAAKQLLAKGNSEDALELLQELDVSGSGSAEIQYLIGTIYHRQNKFESAVDRFKRAIQIDPNFTDAAISLSIIYNDTGHYEEGKKVFQQAEIRAKKSSNSPSPSILVLKDIAAKHIELGSLYRKLQRYDEAANEYLKASRIDTQNVEARILLAKAHGHRKQWKLAENELIHLVREFPNNISARVHLALVYYATGNTVDAQMELLEAKSKDPSNEQVSMYLRMMDHATESTM